MSLPDKVVITCALSGSVTTRKQCPAIPYTPEEYGEEARRAWEAGAAVLHIHARTDDGMPTYSSERYGEIKKAIQARCPIILNFSTGAVGIPMEERVAHIIDHKPAIGALNMGSLTYAKYSEKRKDFVFDFVFSNPFSDIIFLMKRMNESGVKPELECFDVGHPNNAYPLLDMGVLKPPLDFSFILGVQGGIPASIKHLTYQVDQIPAGSTWKTIGISRDQWFLTAGALAMGGNVRVGLEDNFYLPSGEMAKSNGDLVGKAAAMAKDVGRSPASVDEAKKILGLA